MPTLTGEKTQREHSIEHGEECCKLANQRFHLQQEIAAAQQQILEQQAVIERMRSACKYVHEDLIMRAGLIRDDSLNIGQDALDGMLEAINIIPSESLQQHVNAEKVKMLENLSVKLIELPEDADYVMDAIEVVERMIAELTKETPEKILSTPQINKGEIYAGAIILPDGTGHHIILLDGDNDDATWNDAMAWAKSIGGDLPDRVEQSLLFANLKDRFKGEWYWSNTQHASDSGYAWCQGFGDGYQSNNHEHNELRARAVRRLVI